QVGQRYAVQIVVDEGIQLPPHGESAAILRPVTAAAVQAGTAHRGQSAFRQTQNTAHCVLLGRAGQPITAPLAPDADQIAVPGQQLYDAFQIFLGNILPGGDFFQGDVAYGIVLRYVDPPTPGVHAPT